jgi:hypothetical protein
VHVFCRIDIRTHLRLCTSQLADDNSPWQQWSRRREGKGEDAPTGGAIPTKADVVVGQRCSPTHRKPSHNRFIQLAWLYATAWGCTEVCACDVCVCVCVGVCSLAVVFESHGLAITSTTALVCTRPHAPLRRPNPLEAPFNPRLNDARAPFALAALVQIMLCACVSV